MPRERLGVTQPAVSQQVARSSSGSARSCSTGPAGASSRPRPGCGSTAGAADAPARGAADRGARASARAPLTGTLEIGASTGPAGSSSRCSSASSSAPTRSCTCRSRSPTRSRSSSRSPIARLELGDRRRGAPPPRRSSSSRSSATRSSWPARPAPVCRPDDRARRARDGPLIVMQQGAGVRQMIEDELRKSGRAAARSRRAARARAAGVGEERCAGRATASPSSRGARSRRELAAGTLAEARVKGLDLAREISLVRAAGRAPSARRRGVRRVRARAAEA